MNGSLLRDVVIGLDGSDQSRTAFAWAVSALGPEGRIHAVHVMLPVEELMFGAAQADSVAMLHRREIELSERWLAGVDTGSVKVCPSG